LEGIVILLGAHNSAHFARNTWLSAVSQLVAGRWLIGELLFALAALEQAHKWQRNSGDDSYD
jgi:hypothetical protein